MRTLGARRRLHGWVPLAVLVAAAGGAAALGLTGSRPAPSVAQVLDSTSLGQTMRYTARTVTRSTNPDLRSTSSAVGSVDLRTGDGTLDTSERSIGYSRSGSGPTVRKIEVTSAAERTVGGRLYMELPVGGWIRFPPAARPRPGVLGALSGYLGALGAPARDLQLVPAGTGLVGGVPVSAYHVVVTSPVDQCAAGLPVNSDGSPALTEIWIDRQGRLRQVQTEARDRIPPPPPRIATLLPTPPPAGAMIETTELRVTSYGQPVRVEEPRLRVPSPTEHSSEFAVAGCRPRSVGPRHSG